MNHSSKSCCLPRQIILSLLLYSQIREKNDQPFSSCEHWQVDCWEWKFICTTCLQQINVSKLKLSFINKQKKICFINSNLQTITPVFTWFFRFFYQLNIMYVGGPNVRKDYHIEEGEEVRLFMYYQIRLNNNKLQIYMTWQD